MNEKVTQVLQKGKEIAMPICLKCKSLALQGYAKGNDMMDKVSFLQKPLHKKIVWGAMLCLIVSAFCLFIGGSDDYADPYKFVEMMVKEDMFARKDFYHDNGISGYKILRAEENENEENVIECAVQFFTDSDTEYYQRYNEMSYGELCETVYCEDGMGDKVKNIVDEINKLKDEVRGIKLYEYRRKGNSEVEKDMIAGGPIERRFVNGKWRPRYHMNELTDGTYFLRNIGYSYTRKCAQDFEKETVAVFCDADGDMEDKAQKDAVAKYQEGVGRFRSLWWKWDKEFVRKGDSSTEAWRKENLKYLSDMRDALKSIKPVPKVKAH